MPDHPRITPMPLVLSAGGQGLSQITGHFPSLP